MSRERPPLLKILELERSRRDGKITAEEFDAAVARLKGRSPMRAVPWKTIGLLALAALVIAGMLLS